MNVAPLVGIQAGSTVSQLLPASFGEEMALRAPRLRAAPRGRGRAAGARAPSGRPGAHATGARALTARGAVAQAAGQTHAKDKAEIRVVLAMLRDATPG